MTPAANAFSPTHEDGILCCEVGRERYAFRSSDIRHVERAEYVRVDGGTDGRRGTLRLGSQQVPVFALGQVLGGTSSNYTPHGGEGHVAITGERGALVGWQVDRIARAPRLGAGDIAALPPILGAPATSWFEGLVRLDDDESALLIAPHHLASGRQVVEGRDPEVAFERRAPTPAIDPEPVAVVFSTTALPASAAIRYALSGRQIAAIVQSTEIIAVPGCSDRVRGVMWWRRVVVPVIDFRNAADRDATPPRRRLIVQCGARQHVSLIAFSIDSEVVMCRPATDHRLLPAVACPPFASGVFDVNGEAVALLDLDALLAPTPPVQPS